MSRSLPELSGSQPDVSAAFNVGGEERTVTVGDEIAGWTLRAAWVDNGLHFAVLENAEEIAFVTDEEGAEGMALRRPFGELSSLGDNPMARFEAEYYEQVLGVKEDVLAGQVRGRGEVCWDAVADLLPPVLDMTFLADRRCSERPVVRATWEIEGYFPAPVEFGSGSTSKHYRHGLLDGSTNALCYGMYDEEAATGIEMIAFALADDASGKLAVYRRVRTVSESGEEVVHERACDGVELVGAEFYVALLQANLRDMAFLTAGAQITVPEGQVQDTIEASRLLGDLTFRGVLPAYGIGYYSADCHLSFPPALIFLAWASLEWGYIERARAIISHYLSRRVNDDGTFDYYGPAVAEYGQVLCMAARLVQLDYGATDWWQDYHIIIRRVMDRLCGLREASKERNAGDVKHRGLVAGLPEADYHQQEGEWGKYYFAGDVWVCRAMRDVGKVLCEDRATMAEGQKLIAESHEYERDIAAAIEASIDRESGFVPAGPDEGPGFERMTESRHASYCNYRYLLEMVSAGIADDSVVRQISEYRRAHGGELLGMTRFQGHVDDWPTWHYARGILDIDDVDGYLMTFYGHLAHHQSRGNCAAYEQVLMAPREDEGHRRCSGLAEQVLPCQVMGPLMLKHMLVDEERDSEILYLLRACPGHWLTSDEGLSIEWVPTRWGAITSLSTHWDGARLTVSIEAPHLTIASEGPDEICLRVALPGRLLDKVKVNGEDCRQFDPASGVVKLPAGECGQYEVTAEYSADRT